MQLIPAKEIFDEARCLLEGRDMNGRPHPQNIPRAEELLNEILNNNEENTTVLYVLASLHLAKSHYGLAIRLLRDVTQRSPNLGEAWNNLGLAYKEVGRRDYAVACAAKAATILNQPDVWSNLAGCYVNRGMPEKVLEPAEEALKLDPGHVKAQWHKALALLEMGRWDEAWEWHESRLEGGGQHNIATRNYHKDGMTPWWDGKSKGRVVIHGEQGMGDEIMFASCIPDALKTGADFIIEPSPRVAGLFKRAFPEAKVYGTDDLDGRDWIEELGPPDFKIGMGSLPKFFRLTEESFPRKPYMIAEPARMGYWAEQLHALGDGLRVGLAWQGGVQETFIHTRSFHPRKFAPLLNLPCHFISLQYDMTAQANVDDVETELGVTIHHWPKAVAQTDPDTGKASDLDNLAALVANLDLVITVPQTCYHVSGALGIETWILTPSEPDWRLGVRRTHEPFYGAELFHQEGKSWDGVIAKAAQRLEAKCS